MNKKIKGLWVRALRSGRYKQTQNVLQDDSTKANCCLGVLCRVMKVPRRNHRFVYKGTRANYELPHLLLDDVMMSGESQRELIRMNDGGKPFSEIADYIHENL